MNQPKPSATFLPNIFIAVALILILVPFVTTFNSFLTDLFLKWHWYRILQDFAVPYEAKVLGGILSLFPTGVTTTPAGVWYGGRFLQIEWNCLGWQSAVLLLVTFLTGFHGKFTWTSRFEVVIIGVLGTYLMNISRLVAVALIGQVWGKSAAIIFHDYLVLFFVIAWFFLFWWFSYSFVLESREQTPIRG